MAMSLNLPRIRLNWSFLLERDRSLPFLHWLLSCIAIIKEKWTIQKVMTLPKIIIWRYILQPNLKSKLTLWYSSSSYIKRCLSYWFSLYKALVEISFNVFKFFIYKYIGNICVMKEQVYRWNTLNDIDVAGWLKMILQMNS